MALSGRFVLREFGAEGFWRLTMPGGNWERIDAADAEPCGLTQAVPPRLFGGGRIRAGVLADRGEP